MNSEVSGQRVFIDSSFIFARLNRRDPNHRKALEIQPKLAQAKKLVTGTHVLLEIGDGLSRIDRDVFRLLSDQFQSSAQYDLIHPSWDDIQAALDLYATRPDKNWGMTDCLSFVVMKNEGIKFAATADKHFQQAGFEAMLLAE